jgi:hypothetical protein
MPRSLASSASARRPFVTTSRTSSRSSGSSTARSYRAQKLVHLYADRGSPKFEPAAMRWLVRYLTEGTPSIRDIAKVTASLAKQADGG